MYEQVEKPKENRSRSIANSVAQKKNNMKQGFGIVDNRAEAVVQRRLIENMNSNQHINQLGATNHVNLSPLDNVVDKRAIQRLKIVGPDGGGEYKKAIDEAHPVETNNLGWPGMMSLLDELIAKGNFRLINDILMDMPLDRLGIFYNSVQRSHANDNAQKYNLIRIFYNNRRPSNARVHLTEEAEDMIAPQQSEPDISNLTEVEFWHEEALDNTRQGVSNRELSKRQERNPNAGVMNDMQDFMGDEVPLRAHLMSILNDILSGSYLVRRISDAESDGWSMPEIAADPKSAFMKGKESMKAFVVDGKYSFKDKERDRDTTAYAIILRIQLTPKLKTYFANFLFANMKNMLGSQFTFNPQFKFEQGGVTILIPKAGWAQFMSFVGGNYELLTPQQTNGDTDSSFGEAPVNDSGEVMNLDSWAVARQMSFRRGQRITFTDDYPQLVGRIFRITEDWNPGRLDKDVSQCVVWENQ